MNKLSCSYFDGMFSNEPLKYDGPFAGPAQLRYACIHEAGHAVVGYAFGYGIRSIGVRADYGVDERGLPTVGYPGLVEYEKGRYGRFSNVVEARYRYAHFREGVVTAAGPAAERRARFEAQDSQRLLGASEGDHQHISAIASLMEGGRRSRYAYQRLVWRGAQRAISLPAIWRAVEVIADSLYDEMAGLEEWDGKGCPPENVWARLEPIEIQRACRWAGVKKGMFANTRAAA